MINIKNFANNLKLLFNNSLFNEISSIKADIHELKELSENNIDRIKEELNKLEIDLNNNIEMMKTFVNFSDNKTISLSKELDKLKLAFEKLAERVNSSF